MPLYNAPPSSGHSSITGHSINWSSHTSLDFPREILDQLTDLLETSPRMNISKPDRDWLIRQRNGVNNLDSRLRLPENFIKQVADRVDGYVHPARTARLCSSHRLLNPRVIRRIMLLVGLELTQRADRFRMHRDCIASDCVGAWVDRVDAATVLWIGSRAFLALFGYARPTSPIKCKCKCEACVLAFVGGHPQLLVDLRASMYGRMKTYPRRGRAKPRLWQVVESWISHFEDEIAEGILKASEIIAGEITAVNKCIVESISKPEADLWRGLHWRSCSKDEEAKLIELWRTVRADTHVHQTKRQIVHPIEPTRAPQLTLSFSREVLDCAFEASHEDIDTTKPVSIESAEAELASSESEEAEEGFNWLNKKIQSRSLTSKQSIEMIDQVHPAFSDCVPLLPSKTGQNMSQSNSRKSNGKHNVKYSPRSGWATMMVNSDNEGEDAEDSDNQTFQMEWPKNDRYMSGIPEMESDHEQLDGPGKAADQASSYVPARRDWKKHSDALPPLPISAPREVRPLAATSSSSRDRHDQTAVPRRIPSYIPRPAPRGPVEPEPAAPQPKTKTNLRRRPSLVASSVYSSHPGFRRSVAEQSSTAPPLPEIPGGWI